jgi:hypothetical protein
MDYDWVIRNFVATKELMRQGLEQASVRVGEAEMARDLPFVGKPKPDGIDFGAKGDPGYMVVEDKTPIQHFFLSEMRTENVRKHLEGLLENGYKLFQVADPTSMPFKEHTGVGNTVNYVIARTFDTKPLPMALVDYRPGVHVIYPQEHFVKVPVIENSVDKGRLSYYGDQTIFAVNTQAEAQRLAKAMNELQTMFRNNKPDAEVQAFIEKNLPEDVEWWRKKFDEIIGYDQPIKNTFSGQTVFDTHPELKNRPEYADLVNERNNEYNLFRSMDVDFMADRNGALETVVKSQQQPIYKLQTADVMDPFIALERALNNSVRSLYINDMKTSAIEQWVAEFGHLVKMDVGTAKDNPFQAFYHGKFEELGENRIDYAAAINTRERILQFIGVRSEVGKDLNLLQNKVMNTIGENWAGKYRDNERSFMAINDPISFTRKWMFDFIFGFFNPKQFVIQAQGFATTSGILMGRHGPVEGMKMTLKSAAASNFQSMLYFTEKEAIKNRIYKMAEKAGWKKEEFIEAYTAMRNTGWDNIGAEQAMRDHTMDPKLWNNGKDTLLEWGRSPFKEGERFVRMNAWNAAYQEWRKTNPSKKLDQYAINSILDRADDLSQNMTRASNSALQEGWVRLPSQFYTFTQRMMELYWGKRLTAGEKIGIFTTHSALYGVPAAIGAATLIPAYEMIRQNALLEGNQNINKDWYRMASEGFMNYAIWHATGGKEGGKDYNFGERYGASVSDRFGKLMTGQATLLEAGMGATGTFIQNMGQANWPFYAHIANALGGGQETFPLTRDDIIPLLKTVSSVNDAINVWTALNTQKYLNKNGELVANDLSIADTAAMVVGLTRRDIRDANMQVSGTRDQTKQQQEMQRQASIFLRRSYQYMADGNFNAAEAELAKAKTTMVVFGDLSNKQMMETLQRVQSENKTLIERARQRWLTTGNASQLPKRLQMLLGTPQE